MCLDICTKQAKLLLGPDDEAFFLCVQHQTTLIRICSSPRGGFFVWGGRFSFFVYRYDLAEFGHIMTSLVCSLCICSPSPHVHPTHLFVFSFHVFLCFVPVLLNHSRCVCSYVMYIACILCSTKLHNDPTSIHNSFEQDRRYTVNDNQDQYVHQGRLLGRAKRVTGWYSQNSCPSTTC